MGLQRNFEAYTQNLLAHVRDPYLVGIYSYGSLAILGIFLNFNKPIYILSKSMICANLSKFLLIQTLPFFFNQIWHFYRFATGPQTN